MDSKYFREIEAIIREDTIQSTYKLALLCSIIEIVRDSARSQIIVNGKCAYAFSLLQRKLLIYYYPLFAHSSFVPQMSGESSNSESGRHLVIRTEMRPIIQHYFTKGGFEAFLSDLEREEIPHEIISEYSHLLNSIKKTFITQPMKFLGNSLHAEPYSVVQYMAAIPQNESSTPAVSPGTQTGYFTISHEYARIFEDSSCARRLLDSIIQRWVRYTLDLIDRSDSSLTPDELYNLLVPQSAKEINGSCSAPLQKPDAAAITLSSILSGCKRTAAFQGCQNCHVSSVTALEEAIMAEYAQFSALQQSIMDAKSAALKTELKVQRIEESIHRIAALYGLHPKDGAPQGTFEALSRHFAEQEAAREAYSDITDRIVGSKQRILKHKQERDQLRQTVQKARREITIRERQKDLIHKLRHEIALLDDDSGVQRRPFGYVDKPIARFLTYCGDVAQDIVSQCIRLIPDPAGTTMTKPALPAWFIEEFDVWWRKKEKEEITSEESSSGQRSSRRPFLIFDEPHREIRLIVPPQTIEYKEGLDRISLIIHDGSQILHEEEFPLYRQEGGLSTDKEITVCMERPSLCYHVELSAHGTPLQSWAIDVFGNGDPLCLFDYQTGRRIEHSRIPSKEFVLLTRNKREITPETAILSTGRLFGDWYDFQYYVIVPVAGLSIGNSQVIPDGNDRELTKLDLYIDPEYFDRNLRIDKRKVILGSPPHLQILYKDEEILFQTHLFIHPHGQNPPSKPIIRPLADVREEAEIDHNRRICIVDLSHPNLLGRERAGAFTIRIRNDICRTDIRVECVFLPNVSFRFSEPLYLPVGEDASRVQLEITCPSSVYFEPGGSVEIERTETGYLVTSNPASRIQGKLRYPMDEGRTFEGMLSISIPHAAWRFEDRATGNVYPLQRTVPAISDGEYLSLGTEPGLRVFLPESFSGKGEVSMLPRKQTATGKITNGQGYFPLAQFNDTIEAADAKAMHFEFAMENQHGRAVAFPLFILQSWYVHLLHPPKISIDSSGNRVIEIAWEEYGTAWKRFLLLWGREGSVGISRRYCAEELPASAQTYTIHEDRERLTLPSSIYLQFYRVRDDWDTLPVSFPGEKAPNVFHVFIEQKKEPALEDDEETDDSSPAREREEHIDQLISEIETGDAERCIWAINEIKRNHSVPRHGYRLLRKYFIGNQRLQKALFGVITNTGMPPEIRSTCVELLGKDSSREKEHTLITVLNDPDSTVGLRVAILKSLSLGNTEECLKALLDSLKDRNPEIRGEAATSLKMIGSKDAAGPLIDLLGDESLTVQRNAAASLGYTRSRIAVEPLVSIALDKTRDLDLRVTAIAALEDLPLENEIIQRLFVLSEDDGEDEEVCKAATGVLSSQGKLEAKVKKKHISGLIREVKTSSHERRVSAIKQLGAFRDEEVIRTLMESTRDDSADIRKASTDSLRRINSPKAIPALIQLLDDPDGGVQETSELACERLLKGLMSDLKKTEDKQDVAVRYLSEMGGFAVKRLLVMQHDAEKIQSSYAKPADIRRGIVKALSNMNDPYAVELMIQALKDEDDWVVQGAAQALGAIGDKSAIAPLENAKDRYGEAIKRDLTVTFVYMALQNALEKLRD